MPDSPLGAPSRRAALLSASPVLLACLLLGGACGRSEPSPSPQSISELQPAPPPATPPSVAPPAPQPPAPPAGGGDADAVAPDEVTPVVERLLASTPAAAGSEGWARPSALQLRVFETSLGSLMSTPDARAARDELQAQGFRTTLLADPGGARFWLVEDAIDGRGGGALAINLAPARDVWLEAPHAGADAGTRREAIRLLASLGARALVVTGAHRCASATPTPCTTGPTGACGGRLRVSDAAHYADNFFTAAHRALRAAFPRAPALSLHGFVPAGSEMAVISDGTRGAAPAGALTLKLRDALNRHLPQGRAASCNAPEDAGYRPLCATTNVQGRMDNGAGDGCFQGASRASGLFLHLEQAAALRRPGAGQDAVERALLETFPCLPGAQGAGCTML